MFDVCVIGGGASGMAAAIAAAENNSSASVVLLEKNSKLGKKLLATGNGRCNLSNSEIINQREVSGFFERIGLLLRTEEQGRMYPYSGKALDVHKALIRHISTLGITVMTEFRVSKLTETFDGFIISSEKNGTIEARKVVLATGGKAAPQYGSTGDGYAILKTFGHETTRLAPGLTWLACKEYNDSLKGLRIKAKISLVLKKAILEEELGEIQFTRDGLSGICIFNLSNHVMLDHNIDFSDYQLSIDFMPDYSDDELRALIDKRSEIRNLDVKDLLLSIVPEPLGLDILSRALMNDARSLGKTADLSLLDKQRISIQLKNFCYTVSNAGGWKEAQITKGGVGRDQINPVTMESLIRPGLFIAGELLEYAGPCGGFNLHHAWRTGLAAGKHAMEAALIEHRRNNV